MAQKLCEIDPEIQVCALDYRPEFKRLDIQKPSFEEMAEVHIVLKNARLKTVICQTERGHIGASKKRIYLVKDEVPERVLRHVHNQK